MNSPEHEARKLSRHLRPKPVDDYLKNLEELVRRGDSEIAPELKVPAEPRSDDEVIRLRKRLAAIDVATTDVPEPLVQVANVAVARAGLCHARAGLIARPRGKWVPGLAFVFVHPASKTIDTLVLTVPDDGPALMDIAMGLFWHEVNIIPFGEATLETGTSAYYAVKNCPMEMLDGGHMKAEAARLEAAYQMQFRQMNAESDRNVRAANAAKVKSATAWKRKCDELQRAAASLKGKARFHRSRFRVAAAIAAALILPAFKGVVEWLR